MPVVTGVLSGQLTQYLLILIKIEFISSQMNVVGSQQHFAPPSRNTNRNSYGGGARRLVRRNNASASAPLSEIGAGDAPLPGAEVSDACKKLDSLKL